MELTVKVDAHVGQPCPCIILPKLTCSCSQEWFLNGNGSYIHFQL